MEVGNDKEKYQCAVCGGIFDSPQSIRGHVLKHRHSGRQDSQQGSPAWASLGEHNDSEEDEA